MIQTILNPGGQRDPLHLTETKEVLLGQLCALIMYIDTRIKTEVMPEINEDYPVDYLNYCRVDEDGTEVSRDMAIARLIDEWEYTFCGIEFTVEQLSKLSSDSFTAKPESHTEECVEGSTVLVEYEADGYYWRPTHTAREQIRKALIHSITHNLPMREILCDYSVMSILHGKGITEAIHEHLDIADVVRSGTVPILSANPKLEEAVVNHCTEFVLRIFVKMQGIAKEII